MGGGGQSVDWALFASNIAQLGPLITYIAVIVGLLLVISGMYRWAMSGRRGDISSGGAIARIVTGTLLVSIGPTMNSISQTLFNKGTDNLLSYVPPPSNPGGGIMTVVVYAVQIVGLYAVIKGLYILATAWDGRGGAGAAVAHLTGGILAVNIVTFLNVVANTLGGTMPSLVTSIFG